MPLQSRRALFALLFAINLLNYIDRALPASLLPLLERAFPGVDKLQLGYLASAFMVVYMVASPLFGWLGDRRSRKLILAVGAQLWSLATAASGFARTFLQLMVTRVFVGLGEATFGTVGSTVVADLYPPASRALAMGIFQCALPAGTALAYILGGLLGTAWGWRVPLWAVGFTGMVVGLALLAIAEPRRGAAEQASAGQLERYLAERADWRRYLTLLRNRSYLINTVAVTANSYALGGLAHWMPTHLHQDRGMPLAHVDLWFGIVTAGSGVAGSLFGGALGKRLAVRRGAHWLGIVCAISTLAAVPLFYLFLASERPVFVWGLLTVAIVLLFVSTGPANAILLDVVEPRVRSGAVALHILVIHALGDALSPVLMGAVADHGGLPRAIESAAWMVALSGVVWLWCSRFIETDSASASERIKGASV